jgi:hypothetical protein
MARFLIEVPHDADSVACAHVVQIFLKTGSHWVMRADWGCRDGDHKAWLILEGDSKDEARLVVPPQFRGEAKITELNKFTIEEIDTFLNRYHRPR